MNAFENWFCDSKIWRYFTETQLFPWIATGCVFGDHVLEVGAGPGAMTGVLRAKASRVTSLEVDSKLVARFVNRHKDSDVEIVQGDAAALPFPEKTFSSVTAILMLHHMKSRDVQDHALSEFYRVLRPGGMLVAFEVQDGWLHRFGHIKSTFVPLQPDSLRGRLEAAGFLRANVDLRRGGYCLRALRG
jgi:ubiquinone/menaquinone biosynthesis C-methylase UbiE